MMTRQRPPRTSTIRDVSLALTALLLVAAGPALAQPSHDRSHRGDNRGRNADVRGDDRGRHNAHRPGSEQRSRPPARTYGSGLFGYGYAPPRPQYRPPAVYDTPAPRGSAPPPPAYFGY